MPALYRDMQERLLGNSIVSEELFYNGTPCWLWFGNLCHRGYACINIRRPGGKHKKFRAHRVSYEAFTGATIPEGMEADHLCRTRNCINPNHVEIVSPPVNKARRVFKRAA